MDISILTLRILHIGFGMFWVGTDVFLTFLLIPRIRALGPAVERPVMLSISKFLPAPMMVSSIVTAGSGIVLAGVMRGWTTDWILASGWGISILIGFIGTAVSLFVGFGLLPPLTIRMDRLASSFEGRDPEQVELDQLDRLTVKGTQLTRVNSVLLILVVISMAVARFV